MFHLWPLGVVFLEIPAHSQSYVAISANGGLNPGPVSCASGSCQLNCPLGSTQCDNGSSKPTWCGGSASLSYNPGANGISIAMNDSVTGQWASNINCLTIFDGIRVGVKVKVPPGTQVNLSAQEAFQLNWTNQTNLNTTGIEFHDWTCNQDFKDNAPSGTGNLPVNHATSCSVVTSGAPDANGFYDVETIDLNGAASGDAVNGNSGFTDNTNFNGNLTFNITVVGDVMNKGTGDGQTGLVNTSLPKPLQVQVVDGVTGAGVQGVPITFSVTGSPVGGSNASVVANGGGVTDGSGFATASLTLGGAAGSYTVTATCSQCVANQTVTFTATASTLQQTTKLTLTSCDKTDVPGSALTNPVLVQALNTITGRGVPGLSIDFAGPGGSTSTTTGNDGTAEFTGVFPQNSTSQTVTANCSNCQAGPTVTCTASSGTQPKSIGQAGNSNSSEPNPGPTGFKVWLAFQALQPSISPKAKRVYRPAIDHIGVLQGDSVRLTMQLDPPQTSVADSDISWSGASNFSGCMMSGTENGRCTVDIALNSVGFTSETVTVRGIQTSVLIEVGALPTMGASQFCATHIIKAAVPCSSSFAPVFLVRARAVRWAESIAFQFSDGIEGIHNGRADAARHAFWNASMASTWGATVAEGISFGHEHDQLNGLQGSIPPHNDTLMDLDNNHQGALIGAQFPPLTADTQLQDAVLSALSAGRLTIMDEFGGNDNSLTGLLRASDQKP